MAIAFRAGTSGDGNSSTITVTKPTGVVDGDLIIIAVEGNAGNTISSSTFTTGPSASNATPGSLNTIYKTASSEGSSWSITVTGGGNYSWACAAWSGAVYDTSTSQTDTTNPTTTLIAPSVTPGQSTNMLACIVGTKTGGGGTITFTAPSGMTLRTNHSSTIGFDVAFAELQLASGGATGAKNFTASANCLGSCGISYSLKPTASVVTRDVTSAAAISETPTRDVTSAAALATTVTRDVTSAASTRIPVAVTSDVTSAASITAPISRDVTTAAATNAKATSDVTSAASIRLPAHVTADVTSAASTFLPIRVSHMRGGSVSSISSLGGGTVRGGS